MNMFNHLPPFKWYVLQNFPFIEADFDAITNYQLLCKIVEYLNLNITKTNELGTQVEVLTNWFNNLDVQDEIDNKLDEMAEGGQLAEIINEQIFNDLNDKIDYNAEPLYDTIIMGDSYALGQGPSPLTFGWADLLKQKFELDNSHCYIFAEGGVGFVDNTPETFLELLQSEIVNVTEPNKIKNLIIAGGYNDKEFTYTEIQTKIIEFASYVKTNLPNATIYIGHVAWNTGINGELRRKLIDNSLRAYSNIPPTVTNMVYLNGVEFSLIDRTLMQSDYLHPNIDGLNKIADNIFQSFKTGNCTYYSETVTSTLTPSNSPTSRTITIGRKNFEQYNKNKSKNSQFSVCK